MKIVVIANDGLKEELLFDGAVKEKAGIVWTTDIDVMPFDANIYIDLLFAEDRKKRKEIFDRTKAEIVIVNDVIETTVNLPPNYVRINGWPTFLKRTITEASSNTAIIKVKAEEVLKIFNKKTEWVADIPGFITARIVSTIINEAYFALEDDVSTCNEIDKAMKLGTSYPYGPFEWSKLIGLKNIYSLLEIAGKENSRYIPSHLLKKEANN
jgi:3-hydroxybutyryl-CoA dehydrogenase